MAEIVLDRVSKVYSGGVKGVDDLSLEISDGEFMVLVLRPDSGLAIGHPEPSAG
jgi:ABC-type phosphate/phosphonate transport system ATPase subunit